MIEVERVITGGGDYQRVSSGEVHRFIERRDQSPRAVFPPPLAKVAPRLMLMMSAPPPPSDSRVAA